MEHKYTCHVDNVLHSDTKPNKRRKRVQIPRSNKKTTTTTKNVYNIFFQNMYSTDRLALTHRKRPCWLHWRFIFIFCAFSRISHQLNLCEKQIALQFSYQNVNHNKTLSSTIIKLEHTFSSNDVQSMATVYLIPNVPNHLFNFEHHRLELNLFLYSSLVI